MSYFKRYRRSKTDLQTLLLKIISNSSASNRNKSSSESNGNHDVILDYSNQNSTVDFSDIAKSIQSDRDECLQDQAGNQVLDNFGYIKFRLFSDSNISDFVDDTLAPRVAKGSVKKTSFKACVNELLDILRYNGINLPKDLKTLSGTARNVPYIDQCGGKYNYFGLEKEYYLDFKLL